MHDNFQWGQINVFILLLLILVLILLEEKHDTWAGIVLGCVSILKLGPFLLVFVLIAKKRWHSLLSLIITVLFLSLMATLTFGVDLSAEYYKDILPRLLQFHGYYAGNQSIDNLFSLWLIDQGASARTISVASFLATKVFVPMLAISFVVCCWLYARFRLEKYTDLLFGLGITTFTIISPLFELHHIVWLLLPCSLLIFHIIDHLDELRWWTTALGILAVIFLSHPLLISMYGYNPALYLLGFSKLFGSILLWGVLMIVLTDRIRFDSHSTPSADY